MKETFDYGEILFLGKCGNKCYYCLGKEMPKAQMISNLDTPFKDLKGLDNFLNRLKEANCETIYLSSVITEPLLYKDITNLCNYLTSNGFKVGIRTNGLSNKLISLIPKLEAEISVSINSLNPLTNEKICGNKNVPDIDGILAALKANGKKCRVTLVVNKYNINEINYIIDFLQNYDCISYIQLRKRYQYNKIEDSSYDEDIKAFETAKNMLETKFKDCQKSNYHESMIYNSAIPISLWENVFKKESLSTLNYFSDGKITTHNLLVPSYEKE